MLSIVRKGRISRSVNELPFTLSIVQYRHESKAFGKRPKKQEHYKLDSKVVEAQCKESQLYQLICAYREHGHKLANINPVEYKPKQLVPELDPARYGLTNNKKYCFNGLIATTQEEGSLSDAVNFLNNVYCGNISGEFSYLLHEEERIWFAQNLEELVYKPLNSNIKKKACLEMLKSQEFDQFLAKKFVSLKRYGAEGAEAMMAFFIQLFESCVQDGISDLIIGMPHRGRLNILINLLQFPPEVLFRKLLGKSEFPDNAKYSGDVISHLISSTEIDIHGLPLRVACLNNPSHLEAVNPVSLGKTRCRHLEAGEGEYYNGNWSDTILNLQVHGDGAVAGQGIIQETLLISDLPHYEVGGSIHMIVNNQLAFTTSPEYGRGTNYCSDVAKIISAPVVHVNGDCPEDVVRATILVIEYQRKFRKDVFLDLNCYRQRGHNELDDPTFTNPKLYEQINNRISVPDKTLEKFKEEGILSEAEVKEEIGEYILKMNNCLRNVDSYIPEDTYFKQQWQGYCQAPAAVTKWETGVRLDLLRHIGNKSVELPKHFNIHRVLLKNHVNARLKKVQEGTSIDWSAAEAMAWGSLLYDGFSCRISGQDVGRGTFSHRHVMLVDQQTNDVYIPLNHLDERQTAFFEIANSHLSEEAVLGFEYGMSLESPKHLFMWEAQFGDFFNGAQIQIDAFITSGETKWMRCSGLVMLLPHGYDGAGPEHSSCRIERFLQLSDSSENSVDGEDVNIHIANPTTPAQYFHLLRRQMIRNYRKPLIIMTPKMLLRYPEATSSLQDFAPGSSFQPVIGDNTIKTPENVRKVLFVCGKHYYALRQQRDALKLSDVAIIRVEELCPFPTLYLQEELKIYSKAKQHIWSQEEHQNMGAWTYCKTRFENLLGVKLQYSGRGPLAAPAVGIGHLHKTEAEYVIQQPFKM